MDRNNRGACKKENIRRSPPSSSGSYCSVGSRISVCSIDSMVDEDQKVSFPPGYDSDLDISLSSTDSMVDKAQRVPLPSGKDSDLDTSVSSIDSMIYEAQKVPLPPGNASDLDSLSSIDSLEDEGQKVPLSPGQESDLDISLSSLDTMEDEEQKVPLPTGNKTDSDGGIEHEDLDSLSSCSECDARDSASRYSFASRMKDLNWNDDNIALKLSSGIPVRRVRDVLDFVSCYEKQLKLFRPSYPMLTQPRPGCSHTRKANSDTSSNSSQN